MKASRLSGTSCCDPRIVTHDIGPTGFVVATPARFSDARYARVIIGNAGFKGPPDPGGMVEIAYGIVPGFEGRGFATEAATALVTFAFASGLVRLIRAHTLP